MSNVFLKLFRLQKNLRLPGNTPVCICNISSTNISALNMTSTEIKFLFQGKEDRFRGITVDTLKENCSISVLSAKLEDSLIHWKANEKRGIWFKIALAHADWVPILAKSGFDFHHAKNGYVMMYKWLSNSSCGIPPFAHTMVGVGALVVNNKSELLAVKEKNFLLGHWKFPGGAVEPDEDLVDAAIRELKEETNIDAKFLTVVSLMHAEKGQFGCSDIYVVMAMQALSNEIIRCTREIADCQWIKIDEYVNRDDVTPFNKDLVNKYLEYKKNGIEIDYIKGHHQISKRNYVTYSVNLKK